MMDDLNEPSGKLRLARDLEDEDLSPRKYDVVTVHGWGGSQESSWKNEKQATQWPTDVLPSHIGAVRVLDFNYGLGSAHGISMRNIIATALVLLEQLHEDMPAEPRNLIFIGHDVGGVIVKEAIALAAQTEKYCSIAASTSLMIFFGTPHRAQTKDDWEKIAGGLIYSTQVPYHGQLSGVIKTSSRALMEASEAFGALETVYNIFNVYQDTLLLPVVSEHSATLRTDEDWKARHVRSHMELGRFKLRDSNDSGSLAFDRICEKITRSSGRHESYFNCSRALSNLGGATYRVSGSYRRLLDWLKDCDQYQAWLGKPSGFVNVYDASAFEPTLMEALLPWSFKHDDKQEDNALADDEQVIGFFFDSADSSQSSIVTMFASLAFQLLSARPSLFDHVSLLYERIAEEGTSWRIDTMWAFFRILASCPNHERILCLIGAVEQCEPSHRPFLDELLRWNSRNTRILKIILTSHEEFLEPSPSLRISLNNEVLSRRLADMEHAMAIGISELFCSRTASMGLKQEVERTIQRKIQKLRQGANKPIASLALILVLGSLKRQATWSTMSSLKATLDSIPDSLPTICLNIMGNIPPSRWSWARKILSWVVWSRRPLKLEELNVSLILENSTKSLSGVEDDLSQDLEGEIEDTLGGLACVQDGEVRLLHSSIRDFLLAPQNEFLHSRRDGLLWHDGDRIIAHKCLQYLRILSDEGALAFPARSDPHLRLMDYAVQYWPEHYRRRKDTKPADLEAFFLNEDLVDEWASVYWSKQHPRVRGPSSDSLTMAVEVGCTELVRSLLERFPEHTGRANALDAAIKVGDHNLVSLLLQYKASSPSAACTAAAFGHIDILQMPWDVPSSGSEIPLPIHLACESGRIDVVRMLLRNGADVKSPAPDGMSPLHIACQFGHAEVISELLEWNAPIGAGTESLLTPLHIACRWQQPEAVQLLLDKGVDIGATGKEEETPLHIAAETGRIDIVRLLCPEARVSEDKVRLRAKLLLSKNRDGSTPLHLAAQGVHGAVVKYLLQLEDHETERATAKDDENGNTPLHLAAEKGSAEIVRFILVADPERVATRNASRETPIHLAVQNSHTEAIEVILKKIKHYDLLDGVLDAQDYEESTPLHIATKNRNREIIKLLLQVGASPSIPDQDYRTPLVIASDKGYLEIVELLLQAGSDVSLRDDQGSSALTVASRNSHTKIVHLLVQNHVEVDFPDVNGDTPLLLASQKGSDEIVTLLLENDADVNALNNRGGSALLFASRSGSAGVVKLLLDHGADVELYDSDGDAPLLAASREGHLEVAKLLIDIADVARSDGSGCSALFFAAKEGHLDIVRLLLDARAEVDTLNTIKKTPLMAASEGGHSKVVELLLERHANPKLEGPDQSTLLDMASSEDVLGILAHILLEPVSEASKRDLTTVVRKAADSGYSALLERLLENPLPEGVLENGGEDHFTPLHRASMNGHTVVLKLLLSVIPQTGWDPRYERNRRTPLSYAAEGGYLEIVQCLTVARGVDRCLGDDSGRTPLSYAAERGQEKIVAHLLGEQNSCPHQHGPDNEGRTPLWYAAATHSVEVVRILLGDGEDPNSADQSGETTLHQAVYGGSIAIINSLLGSGRVTSINAQDGAKRTALYRAAYHMNPTVVKALVDHGADPEIACSDGWRALHAGYDSPDVLQVLLQDAKADVKAKADDGRTPLHIAAQWGYDKSATALLNFGADPLAVDKAQNTPLHYSSVLPDNVVRLMLEKAKRPADIKDNEGRTPFLSAISGASSSEKVKAMIESGLFDTYVVDNKEHSALRLALDNEDMSDNTMKLLLEHVDVALLKDKPEDLLVLAAERKQISIFNALVERFPAKAVDEPRLLKAIANKDNANVAKYFVRSGLAVGKRDIHGWTLQELVDAFEPEQARGRNQRFGKEHHPPTRLSELESDRHPFIEFDGNGGKIVKYSGSETDEAALVLADHPLPGFQESYFEVKIANSGETGAIGIGVGRKNTPLNRMPGWEPDTWGYHGDDGGMFHDISWRLPSQNNGSYGTGQIIGCRVDPIQKTVRFTRDGIPLDHSFENVLGRLFPAVGLHCPGAEVEVNFGPDFAYPVNQEQGKNAS